MVPAQGPNVPLAVPVLLVAMTTPSLSPADLQDYAEHLLSPTLTADGTLLAVDFGIMGRIDRRARMWLAEILYGLITGNYARVAEIHFEAQYVPDYHSVEEFATALRAVVFLLLFPTAIFLTAIYTEPLLLLTMAASAWLKRWGVPAVVTAVVATSAPQPASAMHASPR